MTDVVRIRALARAEATEEFLRRLDEGDETMTLSVFRNSAKALAADVRSLADENKRMREALEESEAARERDRTDTAQAVHVLDLVFSSRHWLTEGRGPYEWNDDRYRQEFADAVRDIREAVEPIRRISRDMNNCPRTEEGRRAALGGRG